MYHRIAAYFWMLMIIPTLIWWKDSILWVAFMSLYANIASEFAAMHSKKTADKQE